MTRKSGSDGPESRQRGRRRRPSQLKSELDALRERLKTAVVGGDSDEVLKLATGIARLVEIESRVHAREGADETNDEPGPLIVEHLLQQLAALDPAKDDDAS
ncbi:MAG: hypothetical protein GEU28_09305 [Dehalococcoidia bacterium]|nr:hypothetical protein [Dehalococcoidia bacterium]